MNESTFKLVEEMVRDLRNEGREEAAHLVEEVFFVQHGNDR